MKLLTYIKTAFMVLVFYGAFVVSHAYAASAQNNQVVNLPDVPSNLNFPQVPLGDISFPPSLPNVSNIAGLASSTVSELGNIPNLGQLNPSQFAQNVLNNPTIANSFNQTLQNAGIGATIDQITQVAQVSLNPQEILQNPQALGNIIGNGLQNIAPNLTNQLSGELGQVGQQITQGLTGQIGQQITQGLTGQIGQQINQALSGQIGQQITQGFAGQIGQQITQGLTGQIGQQLTQNITNQLGQQLSGQVGQLLGQQLSGQIGQLTNQLTGQISGQIANQIGQQITGQLAGQIGQQLSGQIAGQLAGQVAGQLAGQVAGQIAGQLAGQIAGQLGGTLAGGLGGALGGALSSPAAQAQAQQQAAGAATPAGQQAQEQGCSGCSSCADCPVKINENQRVIRLHETSEFEQHRSWFVTTWWIDLVAPALGAMTSQFTANIVAQVQAIGGFFDAKHQMETQRLFNTMTAKAHKDYHPSEQLCTIGTNVRSLAASERKSNLAQVAIANYMMQRQLSSGDISSKEGRDSDRRTRLKNVLDNYCRPSDNGGDFDKLCTATDAERMNKDVDFTNTLDNKLTLKLDFAGAENQITTDDERDIFALGSNLFAHNVLNVQPGINFGRSPTEITQLAYYYLDYRAVAAKRSVAQNSFAAIAAEKAEGDTNSAPFLRAILAETGVNPQDIEQRLGENPSYFAQMEVMTKDLYQNPTFYSNLYDKPVNVERKGVALQAIELMQDRDIYNSLLRSESVLATLVETMLIEEHNRVAGEIDQIRVGQ